MLTVSDMMTHLATQLGSPLAGLLEAKVRTAVLNGWAELMSLRQWSYFHRLGTIIVRTGQDDGTIDFDYATRQITLTDSTWPSDVTSQHIQISNNWYPIYRRVSSTVIELWEGNTPADDISDSQYYLQQVIYPLPYEVGDIVQILEGQQNIRMQRLNLLETHQIFEGFAWSTALPTTYALIADSQNPNRWCLWLPSKIATDTELQYVYVARKPPIVLVRESAGTVTVASGVATFTDAVVSDLWEGAVLRLGTTDTSQPTGMFGDMPGNQMYFEQSTEVKVLKKLSSTTCRISDTTAAATDVAYVASTHIDVADGPMTILLQRLVEDQYGVKPVGNHMEAMVSKSRKAQAVQNAFAADGRIARNKTQLAEWYGLRLRDVGTVPNNI